MQARSIATREKLIAATLEVIHDRGYNRATTTEFAKRAGVSRGALLHHFPARSDLILAAMEHLLTEGTRDIRRMAEEVGRKTVGLNDFIEFLWGMFSGRFFYLSVEFINETRTDRELRQKMIPVVRKFHEALDSIWADLQAIDDNPREARVILNLTVCLVRGMGVQTVLKDEPQYFRDLLETWKIILPHLLSGPLHGKLFASSDVGSEAPGHDAASPVTRTRRGTA